MTKPEQKTFVLIHGAFRGGWAWDRVLPLLQQAGHVVFAPTLSNASDATLSSCANEVVAVIRDNDLHNVTLVGHSQGGVVAQAAAEIVAERIAGIVFLDAPVLHDGEAAIDVFPAEMLAQMAPIDRDAIRQPTPLAANEFIPQTHPESISARLTPPPARLGFDPVRIDRSSHIPHTYIFCRHSNAFYPSSHTRTRFDREGIEYTLIDAPHDCNVTHAELVADAINGKTQCL